MAYHAFAGEDWPRALRYHILAGQQAQKLFANHEGIEHFRKALRSAEHLPAAETIAQRQQINASLGELLTSTGQYEPALEHLQEALALANALNDNDAKARACRWMARLHENRSEYGLALDWIEQGLNALGNRETAAKAELLAIAGLIHTRQGNYDHALEQCQQSLSIAETLHELASLAFAYNLRGIIQLTRGNSTPAMGDFQRSLELYDQVGDIHGQARAYNVIANVYFNRGQWPEADHYYRQARDIFNQTGDVYNQAFVDNNLGGISLNQGRLVEALQFYQEALNDLRKIGGSLYVLGVLHMNLGAAFIKQEEVDAAVHHLRISQEHFAAAHARDFLPELYRHFAEAVLLGQNLQEAEAQGQQALSLARELTIRAEEGNSLRVLGEIAGAQDNIGQAERYIGESLAILEEVGDEYEAARSRLALAKVYHSQGKSEQTLTVLDQCIAVFERLQAALDLTRARQLRAKVELESRGVGN